MIAPFFIIKNNHSRLIKEERKGRDDIADIRSSQLSAERPRVNGTHNAGFSRVGKDVAFYGLFPSER